MVYKRTVQVVYAFDNWLNKRKLVFERIDYMISATLIEKIEQLSPEFQKKIELEVDALLGEKEILETQAIIAEPEIKYGSMKGTVIYIADDFDAPMDEFKDYM